MLTLFRNIIFTNIGRAVLMTVCMLTVSGSAMAQERKEQNKPYIDLRPLHFGILVGMHLQDVEFDNVGPQMIVADDGTQSMETIVCDADKWNPGFSVGVLGEMRLTNHLSLRLCPSMHFGQKHVLFHEQVSQRDTTQNIKSTYISFPIDLKVAAPRYNNFRPYFLAGVNPMIDLTARKRGALRMKPMDCYLEVGMGCDVYLPFFKLIPELKFCFGLADILQKDRSDLIDASLHKFTKSVDEARSRMIVLTLYFE